MKLPLMPKATAIWLIENTSLSFLQISEFCGLHELEVQGIADGEVAIGMRGCQFTFGAYDFTLMLRRRMCFLRGKLH